MNPPTVPNRECGRIADAVDLRQCVVHRRAEIAERRGYAGLGHGMPSRTCRKRAWARQSLGVTQ
jgi:hypothetical protein